jgi:hypothetical protein
MSSLSERFESFVKTLDGFESIDAELADYDAGFKAAEECKDIGTTRRVLRGSVAGARLKNRYDGYATASLDPANNYYKT